jgi:hypothetical protein
MIRFALSAFLILFSSGRLCEAALSGFVELPRHPSRQDFECANYSKMEWKVLIQNGQVQAISELNGYQIDKLPFSYKEDRDQSGARHVIQVSDGWIVGFDAGEFGGGLWWFSPKGERSKRLRPPVNAPVYPKDIFKAENVLGFARYGGEVLVFMGLDHMGGRSGRVFRLIQQSSDWTLNPFAVLESSPDAWIVSRDGIVILTENGIGLALSDENIRKLHTIDFGSLYPSSMVQESENVLYIGMRHYVLKLERTEPNWKETWFVKKGCIKTRVKEYKCLCVD